MVCVPAGSALALRIAARSPSMSLQPIWKFSG
jgi:hypothetical protein